MTDWLSRTKAIRSIADGRSYLSQSLGLPKIKKVSLAGFGTMTAALVGGFGWLALSHGSAAQSHQTAANLGSAIKLNGPAASEDPAAVQGASATIKVDDQTFSSKDGNLNKTIITNNGSTRINISIHSQSKTERGSSTQQNSSVEATSSGHQTITTNETTEVSGP